MFFIYIPLLRGTNYFFFWKFLFGKMRSNFSPWTHIHLIMLFDYVKKGGESWIDCKNYSYSTKELSKYFWNIFGQFCENFKWFYELEFNLKFSHRNFELKREIFSCNQFFLSSSKRGRMLICDSFSYLFWWFLQLIRKYCTFLLYVKITIMVSKVTIYGFTFDKYS